MLEEGVTFGVSRQVGKKSFSETRGRGATCTGGRGGSVLGGAAPGGSSSRGAGSAQLPPAHHHSLVTEPAAWSNALH
jgi:protocatechuate 3,4-dioxygenase beta subunit